MSLTTKVRRTYWNRVLRFLRIKKDEPETTPVEPAGGSE